METIHPGGDRTRFAGRVAVVTGGYGFIGSAIVRALAEAGADIRVIDAMDPDTGSNPLNLASCAGRFDFRQADYTLLDDWTTLLDGADFVFHLAGQTSHMDSMSAPERDLASNQTGVLRMFEACRRHAPAARIVLAGTRQIYGRPRYLPVDEAHPLAPPDINAVHKIAAENYLQVFAKVYGLAGTSLRLTNTYGPGMRIRDARQMFLGVWIRRLLENEPFEVWGRETVRDFTYVDDCVDAFLRAAVVDEAVGRIYNIGAEEPVSLGDLADALVALNGAGSYVVRTLPDDRSKIDIGDFFADWSRIGDELGWRPAVPLREGLRRTLDWYRRHGPDYL